MTTLSMKTRGGMEYELTPELTDLGREYARMLVHRDLMARYNPKYLEAIDVYMDSIVDRAEHLVLDQVLDG